MSSQITLQQLAEKLKGKYWEKGDLKRIYLREGYNTKKMSTKTFVWQNESGRFMVSCRIECNSQPYEWISSQQDQVIENVTARIEELLATTVYLIANKNGHIVDTSGTEVPLNDAYEACYYTAADAQRAIDKMLSAGEYSIKEMPKEEYDDETARLDEIEMAKARAARAEKQQKAEAEAEAKKAAASPTPAPLPEYGEGTRVAHPRFGEGVVTKETGRHVHIQFAEVGEKTLLKAFIKLQVLCEND